MPAVEPCGPGVDVEQVERLVELHFQDVRVTADEELRRVLEDVGTDARIVVAGVAADMFHEHLSVLAFPAEHLREDAPHVTAVDVAIDGLQWTECRQFLRHFDGADVPGVPDLVAGLEIVEVFLVPVGVGVADDAYLLHFQVFLNNYRDWSLFSINSAMSSAVPSMPKSEEFRQRL